MPPVDLHRRGGISVLQKEAMNEYAPCPQCRNSAAERMKFTWWGGLLGPKILTHVKCLACGKQYNGKTGKENTTGIAIYLAVVAVVCIGLVVFMLALVFATRLL